MKRQRRVQQILPAVASSIESIPTGAAPSLTDLPVEMQQMLIGLAEDLGRLMAVRELGATRKHRRGYTLVELLLSACIMAVAILLVYRVLS